MVTKVTAFFRKYMIASAHYLKSYSGAGVNPAPVSWPVNGPKRLGIHLASDCGKPPYQWLRQTDLKQPQFASLYYCLKALMRSVPVLLVVIFLYISWLNLVCFLVTPNFALAL
jgi:hypothetical protein